MARITEALDISTLAGLVDGASWVQLVAISRPQIEVVGSAVITHADSDTPTLCDVYVHVGHRRVGVATELVRAAKRWADRVSKELYLHVKSENVAARQLYEDEGFEYTGEVKEDGSLWMVRCACDGRLQCDEPVQTEEGGSNG